MKKIRAIGSGIREFNNYCNSRSWHADSAKVLREAVPAYLALKVIGSFSGSNGLGALMDYASPVASVIGAYHGSRNTKSNVADTIVILTCAFAGMDIDNAIHGTQYVNGVTRNIADFYDAAQRGLAYITNGHKSGVALATLTGGASLLERISKGIKN